MSKQEEDMIRELKSFEVNPPSDLWNDIDLTLKARSRKRIIAITSWASAATIALLFSIGGYLALQKDVNILTQTNPSTLPSKHRSNSTIKKDTPISASITNSNKEDIIKTRNLLAKTNLPSTDKPNSSFATQDIEDTIIPQKIEIIEQARVEEAKVNQEKLNLNTSIQDKKEVFLAMSDIKDSKNKGNWYLSASGFPVYSYHSAGATNKVGTDQQAGIVSMGGSISVRYEFANRISIESGLSLGFLGQKEKNLQLINSNSHSFTVLSANEYSNNYGTLVTSNPNYSIVDIQTDNRLTFDVASNLDRIEVYQKFRYLEIPIVIAKRFNIKKLNLFVKGGLSAGFLVQNLLDIKGSDVSLKGETKGVDKYITTAITSFGVSVPLLQKFNFIIEPSFKLGLKPLGNSKTKSFPFSSYIKFGVEVPI